MADAHDVRVAHARTTHRLARARRADALLDARAGRVPGDVRAGVGHGRARDRLRHRPDRAADPQRAATPIPRPGMPFSSRNLVACLREGAGASAGRRATTLPAAPRGALARRAPASPARRIRPAGAGAPRRSRARGGRRATSSGSPRRTSAPARARSLTQIAADALDVPPERVRVDIGDSALPFASLAGGSMGTASWGTAIVGACRKLRAEGEPRGVLRHRRRDRGAGAVGAPRLRRAVLRGPRRRGHGRGHRLPDARRLRGRPRS